ncbi:mitotic-spindle organizing protein 1B-like isoform X1 [Humulus lupulus]|uniref:mitotic-spindle organizing protein 1B-like isoform X1 n=1 Tax=Humulus lupulus TaxID=3486 RepID=UPI002B407FA7|nr:mitotic-spindle organizing protein 1B-like isoform X1 [Humulus lupulus]XP_062077252.1 mitotic-spindle organizing protein 1B-like isoform X1 [Humulus lupulus]XP_062077254.1 mitotic-spindle organizing protein 1B-like isoform X1 [Humulus lupulus]
MFVVKGRQGCREGGGPGKGQWLHVDAHYSQASMTSKLSHASMASRSSLQDFFGVYGFPSLSLLSNILDTVFDCHTLSTLIALCDLGLNPKALAAVVKELRREIMSSSVPPVAAPLSS